MQCNRFKIPHLLHLSGIYSKSIKQAWVYEVGVDADSSHPLPTRFDFVDSDLVDGHKLLSWLGSVIGVPFIAAGLLKRNGHSDIALALTFIPVGFLFIYKILPRDVRSVGNSALSTVAVLSIVVSSILVKNFYGMYTAIAIIVAGTFVGTEGEILSVPRVDIFHYMLAIGNLLYIKAVFGK